MTPDDHQLATDFEAARTGAGTRRLTLFEALRLLDYCSDRGWAFQSMETSELEDELEHPRVDHSLLGLTAAEKSAASPEDLRIVARGRLLSTGSDARRYIFQVWIDRAEDMLRKTKGP